MKSYSIKITTLKKNKFPLSPFRGSSKTTLQLWPFKAEWASTVLLVTLKELDMNLIFLHIRGLSITM